MLSFLHGFKQIMFVFRLSQGRCSRMSVDMNVVGEGGSRVVVSALSDIFTPHDNMLGHGALDSP